MKISLSENKKCLNGWWDIQLCAEKDPSVTPIPGQWNESAYLVPSFWNKSTEGSRIKGETYFREHKEEFTDEYEYLLDGFGYPAQWSNYRKAWIGRDLQLDKIHNKNYYLSCNGVMPHCSLFINGQMAGDHCHPTLPMEIEISRFLRNGINRVDFFIDDYQRDGKGRPEIPTGNKIPIEYCGIWQDVYLIERDEAFISDMKVVTSTRQMKIDVSFEISNITSDTIEATLQPSVYKWKNNDPTQVCAPCLQFEEQSFLIPPDNRIWLSFSVPWKDAQWWYPESPVLYWLQGELKAGDALLDNYFERFGFRELWIDKNNLMLNDFPLHIFSDWGHKYSPYCYTEAWIKKWFSMIRDCNMNHSRLHAHPHPPIYLDIADEEGILITGETGLHGSLGDQASESPEYWENAEDHVRRFIKRDKNHPSLILWSVENEMRWNNKGTAFNGKTLIETELPRLKKLFNTLDPTRPAYHEGDSSLWNEKSQTIISRHYGKEITGSGWWDKEQPLIAGEMSLYHHAGPNNTLHLGGDQVFSKFKFIAEAAAKDTLFLIEEGRSEGVCGFGPWNLSCLENLRMEKKLVQLTYKDYTSPGIKPLQVPAYSSEFSFWKEGAGYTPGFSFSFQKKAFRPVALIDTNKRNQYVMGNIFNRNITLVNDSNLIIKGKISISITYDDILINKKREQISLSRGTISHTNYSFILKDLPYDGEYLYTCSFIDENGNEIDSFKRSIWIASAYINHKSESPYIEQRILIYGTGSLKEYLKKLKLNYSYISQLDEICDTDDKILIMEKNTVVPGSSQNVHIQSFLSSGGRVILMEQIDSLFKGLKLESKQVQCVFIRSGDHPVTANIDEKKLRFWGDSSYSLLAGDSYVAEFMYRKDDGSIILPLLDSGEGSFGSGDLGWTPLWEMEDNSGLLLANQLSITDKIETIPAAQKVFLSLLDRCAEYQPGQSDPPILLNEYYNDLDEKLIQCAEGRILLIENADKELLSQLSEKLDIPIRSENPENLFQAVKVREVPLFRGVSNEDLCGIESWAYSQSPNKNTIIADTVLLSSEHYESLLVTPSESCLKELFVEGGMAEPLRAHTLSRFLFDEKAKEYVVLARFNYGKGQIIINQFNAIVKDDRIKFSRLKNRIMANLGLKLKSNIFSGNSVPDRNSSGKGYPEKGVYLLYKKLSDIDENKLIEATLPTMERMSNKRILTLGNWENALTPGGIIKQPSTSSSDTIYIYYNLFSPTVRKNINTNLNVPNPEKLTFLEVANSGEVSLFVNGGRGYTIQGKDIFSDIAMELGTNQILIRWKPDNPEDILRMSWRNIHHQIETSFQFSRTTF